MSYSYKYSYCRSMSRLQEVVGERPSQEGCCKCCSGSNRYAISGQLVDVRTRLDEVARGHQLGKADFMTYTIQKLCLPLRSTAGSASHTPYHHIRGYLSYLSTAHTRERHILLLHRRFRVYHRGLHLETNRVRSRPNRSPRSPIFLFY